MKIVMPEQMRKIDQAAVRMGVPSLLLMENAASGVIRELPEEAQSYAVFCGKGNNGGDGYAIARQLYTAGKNVKIIAIGKPDKGDAKINYEIAKKIGVPFSNYDDLSGYDIIIDALLGTGLSKKVEGEYARSIEKINKSGKKVYSVDIPSGVDGKTGETLGISVNADVTVTFCLPKAGLYYSDSVGRLVICPISIPKQAIDEQNLWLNLITDEWVKDRMPKRKKQSHKGDYGKVLIIAGSVGMTGAARLCCGSALRMGSGIVYLAVPKSLNEIMENSLTEAITIPVREIDGVLDSNAYDDILPYMKMADVLLVGCGLSTKAGTMDVFRNLMEKCEVPMVIDADGLNLLAKDISLLKRKDNPKVLTPHIVEFSRLSGIKTEEINNDRINLARQFAMDNNVVLVLKGAGTVIAAPEGECYISPTGNAGMATGGSGDVLSGMIASLIGQGVPPFDAAVMGVYLHGKCADIAAGEKGQCSMLPTDMIECIPKAVLKLHTGVC